MAVTHPKRTIMLPVDNTPDSERAIQWTIENFIRQGDTVVLHHVVLAPSPEVMAGLGVMEGVVTYADNPEANQKKIEDAKSYIEDNLVPKLKKADVPCQVEVEMQLGTERVGDVICRKAAAVEAAAVIMASHKKNKLAEIFLGSVSKYTAGHTQQATIILH